MSLVRCFKYLFLISEKPGEHMMASPQKEQSIAQHTRSEKQRKYDSCLISANEPPPPLRYTGLENQGATCDLNTVLQMLFMTEEFREAVEGNRPHNKKPDLNDHIAEIFKSLKPRNRTAVTTERITDELKINVYKQEDAAKCLQKILNLVDPEISKIFQGTKVNTTVCKTPAKHHKPLEQVESFFIISISLESQDHINVQRCFDSYFAPIIMCGEGQQLYCKECEMLMDTETSCSLKKVPSVLVLHLERFELDYNTMRCVKNYSRVEIPDQLAVTDESGVNHRYDLYAIANHSGSLIGGYYYADIRSFEDQQWYRFNDCSVHQMHDLKCNVTNPLSSQEAYLLLYKKCSGRTEEMFFEHNESKRTEKRRKRENTRSQEDHPNHPRCRRYHEPENPQTNQQIVHIITEDDPDPQSTAREEHDQRDLLSNSDSYTEREYHSTPNDPSSHDYSHTEHINIITTTHLDPQPTVREEHDQRDLLSNSDSYTETEYHSTPNDPSSHDYSHTEHNDNITKTHPDPQPTAREEHDQRDLLSNSDSYTEREYHSTPNDPSSHDYSHTEHNSIDTEDDQDFQHSVSEEQDSLNISDSETETMLSQTRTDESTAEILSHDGDSDSQSSQYTEEERDSVPRYTGARKPRPTTDRESSSLMPMRIILLGFQNAEKSSAGNTILDSRGSEGNRRLECVVRQGQVNGRPLTVVEAPGWSGGPAVHSIELLKREIVTSPALCQPGPHAFLIVIPVNISFTEALRTSVVEHLELLGTGVWRYAMVLFIDGGHLGTRPIEMHIECEGSALQWLLEKCGNRYHVLNSEHTRDRNQVTDLLDKIEEMAARNYDHHFYIDHNVSEAKEQKKEAMQRARERRMEVQKKRETIREHMGHTQKASALRLVLMEHGELGNCSAGNLILGKNAFESKRSAECVTRQRKVAGRNITLVKVPNWCKNRQIPELLQQEIVLSTSLCPPGPHAILLTIRTDVAFREADRSVIEGHIQLLGQKAWSHIIVLFSSGNYLGQTSIEMLIESEDDALRWLLEKCSNRYHVLNTESRDAAIQVQELMDKVEEMVAENRSCLYEVDRAILKDKEERKREANERAHQRKQIVQKQREHVQSQMGVRKLSELRLVLMGLRTSGKSSARITILGREAFELKKTAQSEIKNRTVAGRKVTLVESPCWSESNMTNTAKLCQLDFMHSLFLCHPGPHALLFVIRVDSKYNEMNNRVLEEHLELLSQRVWSHTIVLFTHEDWLGQTPIEMLIESGGSALLWLMEKCSNRYHVLNTSLKNDDKQVMQLFEKIEEMVAENDHCYYQLDQKIIEAVKERRRAEERAKEREIKALRQRKKTRAKRERSDSSRMKAETLQRLQTLSLHYEDSSFLIDNKDVGSSPSVFMVQDLSRVSPVSSYLSLRSNASISPPPNFSSGPVPDHSEHLTSDRVEHPMCKKQLSDPMCRFQGVLVRSASEEATLQHQIKSNPEYRTTKDYIKTLTILPDL